MNDKLTLTLEKGSIVKINGQPKQLGCNLIVNVPLNFLEVGHDILEMPEKVDNTQDEPPAPVL